MLLRIPPKYLDQIRQHAEEDYPQEACGILVGPKNEEDKVTEIYRCKNVQDTYHAQDPISFPRTAKTAYFIDPADLVRIQRETRQKDWEIRVIYHSHVDTGAYFSEEDQRIALSEGRPAYPGVSYLVISAKGGRAEEAALFVWDEGTKAFSKVKN